MREAWEVVRDVREYGESTARGVEAVVLELDGWRLYASEELEDGRIIGYTWAGYMSIEDVVEGDYFMHDGGLSEGELVAAVQDFRRAYYGDAHRGDWRLIGYYGGPVLHGDARAETRTAGEVLERDAREWAAARERSHGDAHDVSPGGAYTPGGRYLPDAHDGGCK